MLSISVSLLTLFLSIVVIVVVVVVVFQLVTDSGILSISNGCPNLTSLGVSRVDSLTDRTLRNLGSSCHCLRSFEAAGCSNFTDVGFTALAIVSWLM